MKHQFRGSTTPKKERNLDEEWESLNGGDVFLDMDDDLCIVVFDSHRSKSCVILRYSDGMAGNGAYYKDEFRGIKKRLYTKDDRVDFEFDVNPLSSDKLSDMLDWTRPKEPRPNIPYSPEPFPPQPYPANPPILYKMSSETNLSS